MRDYLALIRDIEPSTTPEPLARVLKGQALGLVSDESGERFWIVADDEDAKALTGLTFTLGEIRLIAAIEDKEIAKELIAFKRTLPGTLRGADAE